MSKINPPCMTVLPWLKANLGPHCLVCLTGYSGRALSACIQIIAAYNSSDYAADKALLTAFREIVFTLDQPERELVYHSIAHLMNWSDRQSVWEKAGLPLDFTPRRCKFE